MDWTTKVSSLFRRRRTDAPAQARMVGWYDPDQLVVTALRVVLSDVFAARADYRVVQAIGAELGRRGCAAADDAPRYDDREAIWLDYVSDMGDGFASMYTIAWLLGRERIRAARRISDTQAEAVELPRGDVLIMGGDEVYPTPTPQAYEERLVAPYTAAFERGGGAARPDLYAIPGNHDWYDGLQSFTDVFCAEEDLGAWRTRQSRSYFALKLRPKVWLLGVDVQLASDIDKMQIDYFRSQDIRPGDQIILCNAEPDWVYQAIFAPRDPERPPREPALARKNLARLEAMLAERQAEIVLKIAGDQHHYRRHTVIGEDGAPGDRHLVTAGGGGAFLHPTHTHDVHEICLGSGERAATYALKKEYPDRATSRRLGLRNLLFPLINPRFGLATALAYTILSWVMPLPRAQPRFFATLADMSLGAAEALATSPSSLVWVLAIVGLVVAFTDAHRPIYRYVGGLLHALAHLFTAFLLSAGAVCILHPEGLAEGAPPPPASERLLLSLMQLAGGYVLGAVIMGLYLLVSVVLFDMHGNEAFSSLRIEGYKNFLRMRLDKGGIRLWAIGVESVPAREDWEWKPGEGGQPGTWVLRAGAPEIKPVVIDELHIPAPGKGA